MKSLKEQRIHSTYHQINSPSSVIDKQNQSLNLTNHALNAMRPKSKKTGVQIRNRIKGNRNPPPTIITTQSRLLQGPSSHQDIDSSTKNGSKLMKSVSFDEKEKAPFETRSALSTKKSILKNSHLKDKTQKNLQTSQVSVANSHTNTQDQSVENSIGNKVITDKYQTLKRELQKKKSIYNDEIFPPNSTSLYLNHSHMQTFLQHFKKDGKQIEWMRLSELYKDKKLVISTNQKSQKSKISKGAICKTGKDDDFLATVFNSISDKNSLLEKLFENQKINKECIYFVKIHQTQTNIWKYIILDDYIPVIIDLKVDQKERYKPCNVLPAFLNVTSQGNTLEIWPFLLQKAYAKYYSTYDTLSNGNTIDFLQEITGTFIQSIPINTPSQNLTKILINEDAILLAQDNQNLLHPLKNISLTPQKQYTYFDRTNNLQQKHINMTQFNNKFIGIHYSYLHKYYHTSRCLIQQEHVKQKVKKQRQTYILREFVIEEAGECQIGIAQKQKRFFRAQLIYDYTFFRIILVQKQQNSYRWINSVYANMKNTKITSVLGPGEYVVIIIPQWLQKAYDFNLIFKGTIPTFFQRKQYSLYRRIVQQSCMDLAQRYGKLVQVNKHLCSYHFIQKNIGLIIENINNQKPNGHVKVVRSIDGLQEYGIKAYNQEFKNKVSIEISIPSRHHYTVILMTCNGNQKGFLDMFDFGF